jgi:Helicase associated domain
MRPAVRVIGPTWKISSRRPVRRTIGCQHSAATGKAYLAHHATLDSVDDVVIDGFALGRWVKRCRDDYRSGSLDTRQIDELESLPGWTWRGPDERWRQGIAALRAY